MNIFQLEFTLPEIRLRQMILSVSILSVGAVTLDVLNGRRHDKRITDSSKDLNMYLSIDPGEKRSGWARFDETGQVTGFGTIDGIDEFLDWLEDQPAPKIMVLEDYRVNPTISHAFSKVRTIEVIGGVKRYCRKHSVKLVEQRNVVLSIGLRYIGMYEVYYKGGKKIKHVDDEISALAHGEYYLVKNKIKKHRKDTTDASS